MKAVIYRTLRLEVLQSLAARVSAALNNRKVWGEDSEIVVGSMFVTTADDKKSSMALDTKAIGILSGSIVYIGSCRTCIINSMRALPVGEPCSRQL